MSYKEEINNIIPHERPHGIYSKFINRITSNLIYIMDKINLKITPNQITFFSFLIVCFFAVSLYYNQFIISALLINIYLILDNMDGIWARYKKKTSDFGAIFDPLIDRYNSIIIFFSLGLYAYLNFNNIIFLVLPGVLFTLSHIPLEFKYYLEKYKVKNIKLDGKKSLPSKIVFEIFAGDKFFIILPLILLLYPYEISFLALFAFEILKRILWVVKLNYSIVKMYLKK